jgi:NAD(P)H-quinone oxidoreductase subunit 5
MQISLFSEYFNFDSIAIIMLILIIFIGLIVGKFAINYIRGDKKYINFFISLFFLMSALVLMVGSDNLVIFMILWVFSNYILVKMMIHKQDWRAAKESGYLAAKTYILGFCSMLAAFTIFYIETGEFSIKAIINHSNDSPMVYLALILILTAAMTQSALWPFNKWLISSLNSPLPVSAIMHAGLVNGGGFLILRFAPLYFDRPIILNLIFIIGLLTALLGTFWKLIQSDIKRMLACSTMAQMGFMMVQIGLGLFSAAMSHIVLHSIFKSYLFLSSSGSVKEKRESLHYPPTLVSFLCSLFCGAIGSYIFAFVSGNIFLIKDSSSLLISVAFIASSQVALSILRFNIIIKLPLALLASAILGLIYGFNLNIIESILLPIDLWMPQQLNILHIMGLFILLLSWLTMIFGRYLEPYIPLKIKLMLYVKALNASQPDPNTITTFRNYYKY